MVVFLIGAVLIVSLFLAISNIRYRFWKSRNIPFIEPRYFFGNFDDVILGKTSTAELIHKFCTQFPDEKYFGIFKGLHYQLVIKDAEILKKVLVKDFSNFQDRFTDTDIDKEIHAKNLVFLKGKEWKNLRNKLTPTFTSSKLKNMATQMSEIGIELQSYVEDLTDHTEELEITDLMALYTTDVIGTCIFGLKVNSMSDRDAIFRKMGRNIFKFSRSRSLKAKFRMLAPKLFYALNFKMMDREVTEFLLTLIRDIKCERSKDKFAKQCFINSLFELGDTSDEFLMAQAFIFFAAGFETSSTLMSYALYELACNQSVQDKLHTEIERVLSSKTGTLVNYEDLKEFSYLDAVLKETLRKYPPAPFLFRKCTEDWTIPDSDILIEKGINVVIPLYSLHRDLKYFHDPEEFIPERFSGGGGDPLAFIPFGDGPRNCIGARFGRMQASIGIIYFLSKYQVKVCDTGPNRIYFNTSTDLLTSKHGIRLKVKAK